MTVRKPDGSVFGSSLYNVVALSRFQACWAQHKRQYPDELIHKEIEEFNKQCSVWWYNLSEQERDRFQEMADRYNIEKLALFLLSSDQSYKTFYIAWR